ncbi:di-heme oxidoredictase family protein [soil metagenome]
MRALLVLALMLAGGAAFADELDASLGKALFERRWVQAPASTDSADGLGPLFNASACDTCHRKGGSARFSLNDGVLGAGGFIVRLGDAEGHPDPFYGRQIQERAIPGLEPEARIFPKLEPVAALTRMGMDLDFNGPGLAPATRTEIRVAPSLAGRGLIEQVSTGAVLALADPEDRDHDGISGRARVLAEENGRPVIGRFGLKATAISIADQAADAAAFDLGLSSPLRRLPFGDCMPDQLRCLAMATGRSPDFDGEEISRAMVTMLANYVRSLKRPSVPDDPKAARLFASIGCAACHRPAMPGEDGQSLPIFSDLLLHDMGDGLAGTIGDYFASPREWRTAPLMDLKPLKGQRRYLHDGRAATIGEAVEWHGGEADKARSAFDALSEAERTRLVNYLKSL